MDDEKSYYQFLQHLFQEDIYIVSEPSAQVTVKQKISDPDVEYAQPIDSQKENLISEKEGQKVVIVLKESLDKEISIRFNNLLEKLGLTEQDTNIVYLSSHTRLEDTEKALFKLKPNKFVLLGAKEAIVSHELNEDFSTIQLNSKTILTMPDFTSITAEKESVIKCWQVLQKFLEA